MGIGELVGGVGELVAGSLVKDVTYTRSLVDPMIRRDLQIESRTDRAGRFATEQGVGDSTSE